MNISEFSSKKNSTIIWIRFLIYVLVMALFIFNWMLFILCYYKSFIYLMKTNTIAVRWKIQLCLWLTNWTSTSLKKPNKCKYLPKISRNVLAWFAPLRSAWEVLYTLLSVNKVPIGLKTDRWHRRKQARSILILLFRIV